MLTLIVFILVLGLLVAGHEFGHFWTARRLGIAVEEFGFGFPPRIIGFRRGETIYSLNWIPFGGFVRLRGEDGSAAQDPRSFSAARWWRRGLVIVNGVVMNALLTVVLLSAAYSWGVPTIVDDPLPGARLGPAAVVITSIVADSPAARAGLAAGDRITAFDEQPLATDGPLRERLRTAAGQTVTLRVVHDGQEKALTVTPEALPETGEGRLGVGLETIATARFAPHWAIYNGFRTTLLSSHEVLASLGGLVRDLITHGRLSPDIAGPVGVAVLTGQAVDLGPPALLQFAALLSLSLAVINLVPFPALDGGRLLFIVIEAIRGRTMNQRLERWIHTAGFALLLALIVAVSIKDVRRFEILDRVRDLFSGS